MMDEQKFTHGPWETFQDNGQPTWWVHVKGNRFHAICNTVQENDEANARLIAAAPEMYDFLQEITNSAGTALPYKYQAQVLIDKIDGVKA